MKLKPWSKVYPAGTPQGDMEYKFFVALARSKYAWRSVEGIAQDSGLTPVQVEKIIQKYFKLGLVLAHPHQEDSWGYWANVPEDMLPKEKPSLVRKDQQQRMNKAKE